MTSPESEKKKTTMLLKKNTLSECRLFALNTLLFEKWQAVKTLLVSLEHWSTSEGQQGGALLSSSNWKCRAAGFELRGVVSTYGSVGLGQPWSVDPEMAYGQPRL